MKEQITCKCGRDITGNMYSAPETDVGYCWRCADKLWEEYDKKRGRI